MGTSHDNVRQTFATIYNENNQYYIRITIKTDDDFRCYNLPLGLAAEFGLQIILEAGKAAERRKSKKRSERNENSKDQ